MQNLLSNLPSDLAHEVIETLVESDSVRIERIVSAGHASPAGFWYDQDEHEWVLLLTGAARLRIEGQQQPHPMEPGDHLHIAAHQRHRVEWTDPEQKTVWLAVFYR